MTRRRIRKSTHHTAKLRGRSKPKSKRVGRVSHGLRSISEQERLAEDLRNGGVLYRKQFELSQEGIVILDAGTQEIIDANPFLERLVGYSREQVLGKKLWEIEAFKNLKTQIDFEKLRKKKTARIAPLPIQTKAKGSITIELVSTTYQVKDMKVIQCNIHDLTEREQTEENLRLQSEITENMFDGVILTRASDRVIIYANRRFDEMLGYGSGELVGKRIAAINAPRRGKNPEEIAREIDAALKQTGVWSGEILYAKKDGTPVLCRVNISTLESSQHGKVWIEIGEDISERRQTEEVVRDSEERYLSLFDSILDGMYLSTHEGRFVDVNSALVKMFGYSSKQEMLAIADIRKELYFAPEERGSHILDTGQEEVEVYRMRRKDRSEIWVEDHGRYVHDDHGMVIFHEGILRDVTERRRMEGEVKDMARFPVENPSPILRLDAHGTILLANKASQGLLESWSSEIGQVAPKYWCDLASEVLSSGQSREIDLELNERSYEFLVKPIKEAAYVNFYGTDMTERKRLEDRVRVSEERFREAMEATSDGMWDWNVETGEIYYSPAYYRMLGYEPNEFPPHQQSWMNLIHPEDRDRVLEMNQDCIANRVADFNEEYRMKAKNGQWKWILGRGRATSRTPNGRALRMIGTHQDITQRKRMEIAVQESEGRYRSLFGNMLEGIADCRIIRGDDGRPVDFVYLNVNSAFARLTGLKDVVGKRVTEVIPGIREENPELFEIYGRVALTGKPESFEVNLASLGISLAISVTSPAKDDFLAVFENITERKRAEEERAKYEYRLLALHRHAFELSSANDIDTIANRTLDAIGRTLGFEDSDFLLVENGALQGRGKKGIPIAFSAQPLNGRGLTVKAAKTKTALRVSDTRKEPDYVDPKGYDWTGSPTVLSELIVPVILDGEVAAVLSVDSMRTDAFTESDQKLLETLAVHVSSALSRLRDEEKLRRYSDDLSRLVADRTKELISIKERLEYVIASNPAVIYSGKPFADLSDWEMTFVSGRVAVMLGYEPEEFIGHPELWTSIVHPEDRPSVMAQLPKLWRGGQLTLEYRMRHKDGRYRWVREEATVTRTPDGKPVEVSGYWTDVTDRKKAELALRESEDTYRNLFESSPIPLWEEDFSAIKKYLDELRGVGVKDFRTHFQEHPEEVVRCLGLVKILDVNQATLAVYGADSISEFVDGLSEIFNKASLDIFREEIVALAEGKGRFESELMNQTLAGDVKYVSLIVSVAPGYEETLEKVLVSIIDLTERKRLEMLRDQFISAVTHELRTPLVSIQGYLEVSLSDEKLSPEIKQDLEVVKRNVNVLARLVDDLLDVQRLIAGRFPLDLHPLDLRNIIRDSIQQVQPLIAEKKHNLQLEIPDNELVVVGDFIRLSQVMMNLLQNSIKFTPDRGTIIVRIKDEENNIKVQVIDTGIGIRREDLERVFEPFSAIKKATYIKGTGLGMSVTEGLVRAHGGKIWAESDGEGKGATFTVTLPKRKELS